MAKVLQANEKSIPEKAKICFFVFYSMYLNRDYSFIAKPLSKSKENNLPQ
ncbi:MAG: hypothetical protein J6Y92_02780 [Lentisphaeria bacterium]|nr:hypothetical protein [Lentisphaeria bacterium]